MPDEIAFSVAEPNGNPLSATFKIENIGCGSLVLSSYSVNRIDTRKELSAAELDDRSHFSIMSPVFGADRTIAPGQTQNVTIQFDPAIPRISKKLPPTATDTLPDHRVQPHDHPQWLRRETDNPQSQRYDKSAFDQP